MKKKLLIIGTSQDKDFFLQALKTKGRKHPDSHVYLIDEHELTINRRDLSHVQEDSSVLDGYDAVISIYNEKDKDSISPIGNLPNNIEAFVYFFDQDGKPELFLRDEVIPVIKVNRAFDHTKKPDVALAELKFAKQVSFASAAMSFFSNLVDSKRQPVIHQPDRTLHTL